MGRLFFTKAMQMKKPNAATYTPDPALLAALIQATGMSQPVLAKRIGVHDRTLRKWISGERVFPYTAQYTIEQLIKP